MRERTPRGHVTLPHTADVRIEAWAPSAEQCFEEVVGAFVGIFADVSAAPPGEARPFAVGPGSPDRLVVLLLDEVLAAVDADGLVPRAVRVERHGDTLAGAFTQVPIDTVRVVGSVAKGVSYEGLRFGRDDDGRWRCRATIDV